MPSVKGYVAFDWHAIDRWSADDTEIVEKPRDEADSKVNSFVNWLVHEAWVSKSSRDMVARFLGAMIAAGFPLCWLRLLVRTLNPLRYALVYTWRRDGDEVTEFEVLYENLEIEQYRGSPFAVVINGEGGAEAEELGMATLGSVLVAPLAGKLILASLEYDDEGRPSPEALL